MGNKAQTGGILTIISGGVGLLGSLLAFALIPMIRTAMLDPEFQDPNLTAAEMELAIDFAVGFIVFLGIIGLALSVFTIVAGVMATRRRAWGLGLAGAIVSLFLFFPTGVAAIILMAQARPEFQPPAPLPVTIVPPVPPIFVAPPPPPSQPAP